MADILKNIKVVDFTHARAGPHCTMMLGDMGADVIKIERPGGESGRFWGSSYKGERIDFMSVNRNKRGIILDFTKQEDLTLAQALVEQADVLVQNLRPGVMAKFGLDAETLRLRHPSLIYCSISGNGARGPLASHPSYDNVAQAYSGLMSISGTELSGPVRSGLPLADLLTGVFAANGILAALFERSCSGLGQHVQVSLLESLVSLLSFQGLTYLMLGQTPKLAGNHHPVLTPTGLFQAQDGQMVIAVSNDGQWTRLCSVLDLDLLADDPRFIHNDQRAANRELVHQFIEERLSAQPRKYWLERMRAVQVPAGPLNTISQALDDPQVRANEMVLEMVHPRLGTVPTLGFPVKFSRTPSTLRLPPPQLGEHTGEVRNAKGF